MVKATDGLSTIRPHEERLVLLGLVIRDEQRPDVFVGRLTHVHRNDSVRDLTLALAQQLERDHLRNGLTALLNRRTVQSVILNVQEAAALLREYAAFASLSRSLGFL